MGHVLEIKCPDCGPVPIHHGLSKTILIIDWLSTPLNKVSIALTRFVSRVFNGFGIDDIGYIFWLLSKVGLAKVHHQPDDLNSDRAKCIWLAANTRGIKIKEIRVFGRTLELFVLNMVEKGFFLRVCQGQKPLVLEAITGWITRRGCEMSL